MESLTMFNYSRTSTLILLNKVDEKHWDKQPEGFPNTIRWNAGHVYSTAEDYLSSADENFPAKRPEWGDLFLDGTRPSEWPEDVPSKEEIIAALKEQKERIDHYFKDKMDRAEVSEVRDINGTLLKTVEASMQFVTWHEGIHLGYVNAFAKPFE
ncbi:MAG TPA: DinB family protein [Bacillota bacterium]|nr:DinB family protein [Bacillota bacterium]